MSKASLLELCHGEKKYETFSINNKGNSILPRQPFIIDQFLIACVAANNSTLNIQHSKMRSLSLSVSMMNKIMRRKWSAFKLSSEENV